MDILIPINSRYLRNRYKLSADILELIENEVLPHILERFSLDERVHTIELISDLDLLRACESNSKTVLTKFDTGNIQNPNEVVKQLLKIRTVKSSIVVQTNALYPFTSVDSLYKGFISVRDDLASSAFGSVANMTLEKNSDLGENGDLGIFTIYREATFWESLNRVEAPTQVIGLRASEMISLRSMVDIELYELIVNSGFKL